MKIFRTAKTKLRKSYVLDKDKIYLITDPLDFLLSDSKDEIMIAEIGADVNSFFSLTSKERIITPYDPPEMWGSGISYFISRQRYTDPDVARIGTKSIYETVYEAERPEIFFKGTARTVVGHNNSVQVRRDSNWTLPEPELAVIIDHTGKVLAYTIFDDVSARDIEAQNPLYLPESKIYNGSSAFGPYLVTPNEFGDPYSKDIRMRILRNNKTIFDCSTSTLNMKTKIDKQIHYLLIDNDVPDGTLLTTGTSIIPNKDQGLKNNDMVEISIEGIGTLNTVVRKNTKE